MILNISSGGVAYINVTAPSGASISASCQGITVTDSGTCTLLVPVIGTWTVTCTYSGTSKSTDVVISVFGETKQLFFGVISVTAPSEASIKATKSGQQNVTGTGSCILIVPVSGTWSVTSTLDGEVTSKTASVPSSAAVVSLTFVKPLPEYTYTGSSELVRNGDGNWKIKFKTSGILIFTYLPQTAIDVFLVGGGGSGGSSAYAGGGGGGYTKTQKNVSVAVNTQYAITIGAGGERIQGTIASYGNNGNPTSAFGYSASGGYGGGGNEVAVNTGGGGDGGSGGSQGGASAGAGGSNGGDGAFSYPRENFPSYDNVQHRGYGQGTTTREFGEETGDLYAGGGGGNLQQGGAGGGGKGASSESYASGTNGTANTGGGGGGGSGSATYYSGAGGSGIVVIRNKR